MQWVCRQQNSRSGLTADDFICPADNTMEEIDEEKVSERYEGMAFPLRGIFCSVVHLWHDGPLPEGLSIWRGSSYLADHNLASGGRFTGLDIIIFAGVPCGRWL